MFHYIKGRVTDRWEGGVVVETGGVGFAIAVPARSALHLAEPDEIVTVYTHMAVREDDISLFGFEDRDSLQIFHMLTAVSGIGNKAAMSILSSLSPQEIRSAVVFDDADMFTRAQGIGKKSASRIVLELKDKIDPASLAVPDAAASAQPQPRVDELAVQEDAIHALMTLGYSRSEAAAALKNASGCETVEDYIKFALKNLSAF